MSDARELIKVGDIQGPKSIRALNAYSALLLGIKMLPAYMAEHYETFLARVHEMPKEDQYKIFKEAALFVNLDDEDIRAIILFCRDKNGVPFSAENIKNLKPDVMIEMIVAVCMEIAGFKIDLVSANEKKN